MSRPLINERTKAVIPVHYAGYPVAIDRLAELCADRGLTLIEDAAHAPSARLAPGSGKLGSFGLAGCFSFFPNKVLGVGEGGALVHRLGGGRRSGAGACARRA